SMVETVRTMEARWLGGTVARRWLAAELVAREAGLQKRVYHLVRGGELLAVVDRAGEVGILPGAQLERLEQARWLPRPSSAAYIPNTFHRLPLTELVW